MACTGRGRFLFGQQGVADGARVPGDDGEAAYAFEQLEIAADAVASGCRPSR